jgi:hypothetical protein
MHNVTYLRDLVQLTPTTPQCPGCSPGSSPADPDARFLRESLHCFGACLTRLQSQDITQAHGPLEEEYVVEVLVPVCWVVGGAPSVMAFRFCLFR